MEIKTFANGIYRTNNYLVINGQEAVLIDASDDDYLSVDRYLNECGAELKAVLFTHGHFDHIGLGKHFQDKGVPTYIHKNDYNMTSSGAHLGHLEQFNIPPFECSQVLHGGEILSLIGLEFEVIHTPGHTAGCVSYVLRQGTPTVFSGDTLFYRSVGRTDLPTGSAAALNNSVLKLFALAGDYEVLPGHGKPTTMSAERKYNPYVKA